MKLWLKCLILCALGACVHGRERTPAFIIPSSCRVNRPDLSVLTWNGALAPGINAWATPRRPLIQEAVASAPDDIICLQEFWPYDAARETVSLLEKRGLQVFYEDTRGENESPGAPACAPDDLTDIHSCMKENCANAGEETTICAMQKCRSRLTPLYILNRPCLVCLVASVGMEKVEDIYERCLRRRANRVYGGANGVILASRWPMPKKEREVLRLPATGANRVALIASVHTPGGHPIEVACAHLSADDNVPPLEPRFSAWDDERREQLQRIDERLRARSRERPSLLIGDMNFGGNVSGWLRPTSLSLWRDALERGFMSPAAHAWPPICSECGNNSFHTPGRNLLIDHVLVRNNANGKYALQPMCAEPAFYAKVVVANGGKKRLMNLSDHYGIRVQFGLE